MIPSTTSYEAHYRLRVCHWLAGVASFLLTAGLPLTTFAEIPLLERNGLGISATIEVGVGYFDTENTNLGTGRVDFVNGPNTGNAE